MEMLLASNSHSVLLNMVNVAEMYYEEPAQANELKGFTKTFAKRTKEKEAEDQNIVGLQTYLREGKLSFGRKVTEKLFKKGLAKKVYLASNCDELTANMIKHYAKFANVEIITVALNADELAQKLQKPFISSVICVKDN